MGQVEAHDVQVKESADARLANLQSAFLGAQKGATTGKAWSDAGPPIEVLHGEKWEEEWLPDTFGFSEGTLEVLQREEHGIWCDLGPAESDHVINDDEDRVVYRRGNVPYEADMKKMTWRSGFRKGRLRTKPQVLDSLAVWLRREPPTPPSEEAATLAAWCYDGLTQSAQTCNGALLQHHQQRRAYAATMAEQGRDSSGTGAGRHQEHGTASLAGCAYAGALARLAVEPALAGPGVDFVLQILEAQLSTVPPLAVSCPRGTGPSPAFTTALGFCEAFRCSLAGERPLPSPVARRVAGLLLRVGLQAGLSGPVLAAVDWLLRCKTEAKEAEEELRPIVEAVHNVNGPREIQVLRTDQEQGSGSYVMMEKLPPRQGIGDWPNGPALLHSPINFPGSSAPGVTDTGVSYSVHLMGKAEDALVGLCMLDSIIVSPHAFESTVGLLLVGKQRSFCRQDTSKAGWTDFGPRVFQDGDEVELILRGEELQVQVSGEDWGKLAAPAALWSSGARVVVALQSAEVSADICLSPHREGPDQVDPAAPVPTTWAAAAQQAEFETVWQQAETAEEGRISSVLLQCIGRNSHQYTEVEVNHRRPLPVVEESLHNYLPNMNEWKKVEIPGALRLKVEFDRRCETESRRDTLTFYRDKSTRLEGVEPMSGDSTNFRSFEVNGSGFWYNFTTDGSDERWGYKFTVTPTKVLAPNSVPLAAETVKSGITESLESLLQQVSEKHPFGEASLRGIFGATGAELRHLTNQPEAKGATKAAIRVLLRALLRAAEAEYPNLQPTNLAEQLAVEALEVAGPKVAGDTHSRMELMVVVLENTCCPPTLVSAINRLVASEEHYGQLLLELGAARSLLERLSNVAFSREEHLPPANRANAVRTLLQVLGDILSNLACSESQAGPDKWGLFQQFAERILTEAAERLALPQENWEPHQDLLGLLAPALLRGLALSLPATPHDFILPLLPKVQSLVALGESKGPGMGSPLNWILQALVSSSLAVMEALGLSLLHQCDPPKVTPQEASMNEALRCQLIRSVPKALLADATPSESAARASQFLQLVERRLELPSQSGSEIPVPHQIVDELVANESPGMLLCIRRLEDASGGPHHLPDALKKVKRLAFAILVRHYDLEDELASLAAMPTDASVSPKQAAPRAMSLLWKQAHGLAQHVMISCPQEAELQQVEARLSFALHCDPSQHKKLDIGVEEAATAAREEAEEALQARQQMTRGLAGLELPLRQRVLSEIDDFAIPSTDSADLAVPPALSRWASAPAASIDPPGSPKSAPPSNWARLRRRLSSVRTLQLSLKPLRAIMAAEGCNRTSGEPRPVDQLKQLLAVPLRPLQEHVQAQTQSARCLAAALHLLSACVRTACCVSPCAAGEALLALRTAWQLSVEAGKYSTEATALEALHSAQAKAVATLVAAANQARPEPLAMEPKQKAQVQALALCCLCGQLGSIELQAVEQHARQLLADTVPWAEPAKGREAFGLPVRCAALLCCRTRIAAACALPRDERYTVLGLLSSDLLAAKPAVPCKSNNQTSHDGLSLLAAFAPLGGISGCVPRAGTEGWPFGIDYCVQRDDGLGLKTTGPEITAENVKVAEQHLAVHQRSVGEGRHYWEISVKAVPAAGAAVNLIGIAGPHAPREFTGLSAPNTWGITPLHGGRVVHGGENEGRELNLPSFEKGLVIGLLLDCEGGTLTLYAKGECKGVIFNDLAGKGPFSPCISTGSGGFVFEMTLPPDCSPPPPEPGHQAEPGAFTPASALSTPSAAWSSLGGLGVCTDRPTLAWLISFGWVLAAFVKEATSLQGGPLASLWSELTGTLLPLLVAEESEPLAQVLAGTLLEGLPPSAEEAPGQVLTSMASDPPGWVRSAKAAVLRSWCVASPEDSSPTWRALTQAFSAGNGGHVSGALREAALDIVAETARLSGLFPVRIDGLGGLGTIIDVASPKVAVLPADSLSVVWYDTASLWAMPKRCKAPFPTQFVAAIVASVQARVSGGQTTPRENMRELFSLLAVMEDPQVAQGNLELIRDLAPLALAEIPDPSIGISWSAVPAAHRLSLCTALLARPTPKQALVDALKEAGHWSDHPALEVFAEAAEGPPGLVPVSCGEVETPRTWKRPRKAGEQRLVQSQFMTMILGLVSSLNTAEVEELWAAASSAGKEVQPLQGAAPAEWHVAPPLSTGPGAWTRLPAEVGASLDEALCGNAPTAKLTARLPPSETEEELKFDVFAMTLQPVAGGLARRLTRTSSAEPGVDLSDFEALIRQAEAEKKDPSVGKQVQAQQTPSLDLFNSKAFAVVLEALGLPEAAQPRNREALLRLLSALPLEKAGVLKQLLPALTKKERLCAPADKSADGDRDEETERELEALRRRAAAIMPVAAAESMGKWAENHLARVACAKLISCCKRLPAESFGAAAEVVKMLVAVRPLADLERLQEHSVTLLKQDSALSAAFQQAAAAEFLGVLRNCLRPREPVVVEETKHPYDNNMNVWREVRIAGAKSLQVRFDSMCSTESGCDTLQFKVSKDGPNLPGTAGEWMSGKNFPDFTVEGESFWYNFKTDGSTTDWGFKFTVLAQPPLLPRTGYWESESTAPNMEDALWLLNVALSGRRMALDTAAGDIHDLRMDVIVPVLLPLVERLPDEEGRIQAVGALGDLLSATGGELGQLWSEVHSHLWTLVGDRAANWATPVGQAIASLLVRLLPSLPAEPKGLHLGPVRPSGGALTDPGGTQALFIKSEAMVPIEGATVRMGEAATIQLVLSKGVRVGVVPATDGPVDINDLVALDAQSGSGGVKSMKNGWWDESPGVNKGAATLSGEDCDILKSARMEGINFLVRAKQPFKAGVHYWDVTCLNRNGGGNGYHIIGVATEDAKESFTAYDCGDKIWGIWLDDDYKVHDSKRVNMGCRMNHATGAVYGVLLDCDAGELSFFSDGKPVGGVAFDNLTGGPFYPMMCVGCLESNTYQVNFSPENVPEAIADKLTDGGLSACGVHRVTCDLRGGLGASWLSMVEPGGGREKKALPDTADTWRFILSGIPGSEVGLSTDGEMALDVALAKAQTAMEAVAKGSEEGPLPEFAVGAFVSWHEVRNQPEEVEGGETTELPAAEPQWRQLGPNQLLVFGAGCLEVNGVFNRISTDPDTYLSEHEATIVNDRENHWVICTSFNVELWAYEATSKEGPWRPRDRDKQPAPIVCGPEGPASLPSSASSDSPKGGEPPARASTGLPALFRELRSTSASVPAVGEQRLQVPGAERLAVTLASSKPVRLVRGLEGQEESSFELRPGEVAEVEGDVCVLRALAQNSPLTWWGATLPDTSGKWLFGLSAASHGFDANGHMSVGPMHFLCDSMSTSRFSSREIELPVSDVLCRQGHVMKPKPKSSGWHCDKCGSRGENLLRFRCEEGCNWDFCGLCQQELMSGLSLEEKRHTPWCTLAVGDRIKAGFVYKLDGSGQPEKRRGVVTEVREDGNLLISWEDGDPRDREKLPSQVCREGFEPRPELVVMSVREDSAAALWNAAHPELAIRAKQRIAAAQGQVGDPQEVLAAMCGAGSESPLRLSVLVPESYEENVPAAPAVTCKDIFQSFLNEDLGIRFATSPEIRICDIEGLLEVGICTHGQGTDLLPVGQLPLGSLAAGDVIRILVAISQQSHVPAVKVLKNGQHAISWESTKPAEFVVQDVSELRVWVLCAAGGSGPRRQRRAALQLVPFSATGPEAQLPSAGLPSEQDACPDFGGIPEAAWKAFASWWPEAEPASVIAWPVGERDQKDLLADLSQEVDSFCKTVLGNWSMEQDMELIQFVEAMAKEAGRKVLSGPALELEAKNRKGWAVAGHAVSEGYGRYLVLRALNSLISKNVLPVVDLGRLHASAHGRALHALKRLLVSEIRGTTVRPNGPMGAQVKLLLKRPLATACRDTGQCDTEGKQMLFSQASSACVDPAVFRRSGQPWQDQPFSVSYEDEPGVDQGGLYRDFLDAVTEELMSPQLPVLVPTANQSTNSGEHRDTWVLNPALEPSHGSPGERLLLFLGRLMGLCLLRGDILPLTLPPSFWKGLQGEETDLEDLEAIDVAAANSVRMLREPSTLGIEADTFSQTFPDLRFAVEDSGNQRRELVEGGAEQPVTFDDAPRYAEAMLHLRLRESDRQLDVVRRGLREVAMMSSWALWPWQTLEVRVVGVTHIDRALLRKKTYYDGYDPKSPVVKRFWDALEEFTQEQLRSFLHFTWGRSRLPPEGSEKWGPGFKLSKAGRIDMLPVAHTCFFQLELPEYETLEVMKERLLFATQNCMTMNMA